MEKIWKMCKQFGGYKQQKYRKLIQGGTEIHLKNSLECFHSNGLMVTKEHA